MEKIIAFVQNLSLDITAGAIISSLFVAKVFGVVLTFEIVLGLGIAIWLIYSADHLWDAYRINGQAVNPRHAFHQKYFKVLCGISLLVFGIGVYNMFQLPVETIKAGLGLVVLTALYFLYLKLSKTSSQKELFAAFVYVAGIFVGPISLLASWDWMYLVLLVQFFLLAYVNLMLFPLFEMEADNRQGMASIALNRGAKSTKRRIGVASVINEVIIVVCIGFGFNDNKAQFMILAMSLTLLLLIQTPAFLKRYNLYRIIGDGIFFLPGLALL